MGTMIHFVNPMTWLKYSGSVNFMVSNIIASPMISSVMLMGHKMNGNGNGIGIGGGPQMHIMGMMNFGNGNRMFNDMKFMSDELKFYQNNSILMYSSALSYFHHNMFQN